MAFGFVVERFGLFLQLMGKEHIEVFQRDFSFYVGVSFVLLAACMAVYSILQHCKLVKTLKSSDIPCGYNVWAGMVVNGVVGILALALSIYLIRGFV
jgi:putative membrane protein